MICEVCRPRAARTQEQLANRMRSVPRRQYVKPEPCEKCGGTEWATIVIEKTDTHDVLRELVKTVQYKPGYQFRIVKKNGALFLHIVDTECMDAYDPETPRPLCHEHPVPMGVTYNAATWKRWVYEQCRRVENHEIGEWLRWGDERPFAPLHGPGEDPYTVHEYRDPADALITQDGSMR